MASITDRTAYPLDGSMALAHRQLWQGARKLVTDETYTITSADFGRRLSFFNSNPVTVSVPSGLPSDFYCFLRQTGGGQVTISAGVGVTLKSYSSQTKIIGQYGTAFLDNDGTDAYILDGALTA